MGKALKDTQVKIPGAAGPVGKGMPVTQFAGKGGAFDALRGRSMVEKMKMPGWKSLMKKGIDSGKIKNPALPQGGLIERMFNKQPVKGMGVPRTAPGYEQSKENYLNPALPQGGLLGRMFNKKKQAQSPPPGQPNPGGGGGVVKLNQPTKSVFKGSSWSMGGPSGGGFG